MSDSAYANFIEDCVQERASLIRLIGAVKNRMLASGMPIAVKVRSTKTILCSIVFLSISSGISPAQPTLTPSQIREDLHFLAEKWAPRDKSFSPEGKVQFDAVINQAMVSADKFSPTDLAMEVNRALAVSHNGHTESAAPPMYFHAAPVKFWWFSDGLYVVRASPDHAELAGARVEKIGHATPDEAEALLAPFISGTPGRIHFLTAYYFSTIERLEYVGLAKHNKVTLVLRLRNGKRRTVELGPAVDTDPDSSSVSFTPIATVPGKAGHWPHVLDQVSPLPPIYENQKNIAFQWLGNGGNVFYLRSNLIDGQHGTSLSDTLLQDVLFKTIAPKRSRFVIIDLRLNSGGNFFNTILFSQALPRLMPSDGKIFVLVGPGTFSAALVTAALLKGNAPSHTIFIGDTMGDNPRFWAEGDGMTLPNSGIHVMYRDGLHDWTKGCDGETGCFWPSTVFGFKAETLEPNHRVSTSFGDYAAGRDPVLEKALSLAR
jgi:hypothetical protein